MFLIITLATGWGYWPTNLTVGCGPPYSNTIGPQNFIVSDHFMSGLEIINQYGYMNPPVFPIDEPLVEVLRVVSPEGRGQWAWGEGGFETEIVWFFHTPGSNVWLNLSGRPRLNTFKGKPDTLPLLHELTANRTVVVRAGEAFTEIVMRSDTWDDNPTACPDVPFTCECRQQGYISVCNGTTLVENPGLICSDHLKTPHAYFAAAAILVVWAAHASFSVSAPTTHNLRDLATGFVIWWPANVIGDGMPLFVAGGANAAIATLLMTVGNIAVLYPWPKSVKTLRVLAFIGCGAVALSFVHVPVAAFTAGFTGAAATSMVWGLVHNAKAVGIGMTLSAVLSSIAVLIFKSTTAYIIVTLAIAGLSACSKPILKVVEDEDEKNLIEEEAPQSPPFNWKDNSQFVMYYGLAYALPGILPTMGLSVIQYKLAIAFGTAGDICGRLFSDKSSIVHLPLAIIAFVAAIMTEDFVSRILFIVSFYALRGDNVTLIARNAPANTKIGVTGQIGATAGALTTAFATNAFHSLSP